MAAGTYTGIVTVSASSSTIDAPQTITVTVRVGGVDVYVAPGSSRDVPIATGHFVTTSANTQSGGGWLSVILEGVGSFRFSYPYAIHLAPPADMPPGNYQGSVTTGGSSVATENVTIPITMRVTTQPIAQPTPDVLNLQLAQGAPPLVYPFDPFVSLTNLGQGILTPGAITVTGGSWIKADPAVSGFVAIDPTGLSPGGNTGSISIASNAANSPSTIPVSLQIVPKGAPTIAFQGVLDNVTSIPGDPVSQGDVAIVKGDQLSFSPFAQVQAYPLPTTMGGTSVLVNGTAVPLYYTSYGQIAFQMPYDVNPGTAQVQVKRDDGQVSNTVTVNTAARAPRLLAVVNQDGSFNTPDGSHPAKRGDTVVFYAFGLGPTSPAVTAGTAAPGSPLAQVSGLQVSFGGLFGPQADPAFAGLTPTYAGVYQVNVVIPDTSPVGLVNVNLSFTDSRSNVLQIAIQ